MASNADNSVPLSSIIDSAVASSLPSANSESGAGPSTFSSSQPATAVHLASIPLDQLRSIISQIQLPVGDPAPAPPVVCLPPSGVPVTGPLDLSQRVTRDRSRSPQRRGISARSTGSKKREKKQVVVNVSDDSSDSSADEQSVGIGKKLQIDAQELRYNVNKQQARFNKNIHGQLRKALMRMESRSARKMVLKCMKDIEARCTEIQVSDTYGNEVARQFNAGSELLMASEDQSRLNQIVMTQALAQAAAGSRQVAKETAKDLKTQFPNVIVECSGGIDIDNFLDFCSEHVDVVSMGCLTQGYPCIDFSMKLKKK